jgi:S1-C subfamily serine protease
MPGLGEGEAGGLPVEGVSPGTSADEAGIRVGDVMLSWNGSVLHGAGDLVARLREHQPGDVVTIVIRRDGQEQALEVLLQAGGGPPRPE